MPEVTGPQSGLRLLRSRPSFAWIWAGQMISRFGDSLDLIAFMWIILELTGSTLMMGTLVMVNVLPNVLLGPFAGVLVDRWSRKRVMIVADLGRGLVVATLALLWALGQLQVWMLFAVTFISSVFETFSAPARRAVVPLLVGKENLVAAHGVYNMGESLANLFGLAAAGVVVAWMGLLPAIALDAATFFLSSLTVLLATIPELERVTAPLKVRAFSQELGEGLTFVRSEPVVLASVLMAGVTNFALGPLEALLPAHVGQGMGLGPQYVSWVLMAMTAGSLVGAILVSQSLKGAPEVYLLRVGMVGIGVGYGLLGLSPTVWGIMAAAAGLGFMIPLANSGFGSLIQRRTAPERMGRVSAIMGTLVLAAFPLSAGLSGTVAEWVPIPWVFGSMALLDVAVAVGFLWSRPFRQLAREARQERMGEVV